MRLGLAFRAFFRTLFDGQVAESVSAVLRGERRLPAAPEAGSVTKEVAPPKESPSPVAPARAAGAAKPDGKSDALTLLATLQREARWIDFLKEPIGDYTDEQVGAAVRDIHRDCGKVLDRLFAIRPVVEGEEGASVAVTGPAERFRLIGNVAGSPTRGKLIHPGWQATRCEVPTWQGSAEGQRVLAPAEVEV